MKLWTRIGGQLMRQLLSINDVVMMGALKQQSGRQFDSVQKAAAGTLLLSSNLAARGLHLGVQMGAKTTGAAANAMTGWVPGAGLVRDLAEQVDEEATAAAERAARLASYSVELATGEAPTNPVSGEPWLGKAAPAGYGWRELTSDTAASTLWGLTAMPRAAADNAMHLLHDNEQSRRAMQSGLEAPVAWLEDLPPVDTSREPLRQSAASLAILSSLDSSLTTSNLLLGTSRLAAGDPRQLRQALQDILADSTALTTRPPQPQQPRLRDLAKEVLRQRPQALLKSLEPAADGSSPEASEVAAALIEDGMKLQRMLLAYAQLMAWRGTPSQLSRLPGNAADDADSSGRNASAENGDDVVESDAISTDDGTDEDPIDRLTRQLVRWTSGGSQQIRGTAAALARDIVFLVASETLGRDAALDRAEQDADAYGDDRSDEIRHRLAADPSLDLRWLELNDSEWRSMLRDEIEAAESLDQLRRSRDHCSEQLEGLDRFASLAGLLTPPWVDWRRDMLSFYLNTVDQRSGLDGAHRIPSGQRIEAARRFQEWLAAG